MISSDLTGFKDPITNVSVAPESVVVTQWVFIMCFIIFCVVML